MTAADRLAHAFLASHPARAAMALERLPVDQAAAVLRAMPVRAVAPALGAMTPPQAAACLALLVPDEAAAILEAIAADDAAGILRAAEGDGRDRLLAALPAERRDPIARVLRYPEGTAGAVMDPGILHLPEEILVADARTRLRRHARELLYYLYVVDRGHRLVGVLDIRELMLARPRDRVSSAMHRDVDRLQAWMPVALVREHGGWQSYHAMPVVDEEDRLLGAIRYQVLRRLEREAGGRGPDPALLTARALGELFHLGTTGLVAGVAATATAAPDTAPDAPVTSPDESNDPGPEVDDAR